MNDFSQKLDLRQSQSLVMTPQLQQAIKLLQLSNLELAEFVEEELERNPLLEKGEPENTDKTNDNESEDNATEALKKETLEKEAPTPAQESDRIEDSYKNDDFDAGSRSADIGSGGNSKFEDIENSLENRITEKKTLRSHLNSQLFVACDDPRDRMVGGLLIDQLDESGYLRADKNALAQQLGCSLERIEKLLGILKGFDPTGVFAADLTDCLALQLEERGQLDTPMKALLENLSLIADHDLPKLANLCGVNETYLADMISEIRALNPKPAAPFDHLVVQTAIPDVLMKRKAKNLGGGWRVELNSETLPRVLVNQEYYTEVSAVTKDKKDREYITTQLSAANWLVRAMEQRALTILKVSSEIIEQQENFFNYGIEFLQPLTLKDIAAKIDMHESTVSRVTTGKFMGTPRGIFELKFFFSTALVSASGVSHSAESIKARIKTMIDAEDPKKILSDDKIVASLKDGGVDIARRTVAKYREAMHIGSSVQRRKEKKHLAS